MREDNLKELVEKAEVAFENYVLGENKSLVCLLELYLKTSKSINKKVSCNLRKSKLKLLIPFIQKEILKYIKEKYMKLSEISNEDFLIFSEVLDLILKNEENDDFETRTILLIEYLLRNKFLEARIINEIEVKEQSYYSGYSYYSNEAEYNEQHDINTQIVRSIKKELDSDFKN